MISPNNRSPIEYVDIIRHCLRTGETVPHPRGRTEVIALTEAFPEVAEMFAAMGVTW